MAHFQHNHRRLSLCRLFFFFFLKRTHRDLEVFIKPFLPCSAIHCHCLEIHLKLKVSQEDLGRPKEGWPAAMFSFCK